MLVPDVGPSPGDILALLDLMKLGNPRLCIPLEVQVTVEEVMKMKGGDC